MAAQGLRQMDEKISRVKEDDVDAAIRKQAKKVHIQSFATAAAVTLIYVFL